MKNTMIIYKIISYSICEYQWASSGNLGIQVQETTQTRQPHVFLTFDTNVGCEIQNVIWNIMLHNNNIRNLIFNKDYLKKCLPLLQIRIY